jgi:hypothetical protein
MQCRERLFRQKNIQLREQELDLQQKQNAVDSGLATFRRKIDVFGRTVNGFGRARTAGLPAVFFEGLW